MVDILKILTLEQDNRNSIYLYEEDGYWYAYEQSAFYLSQMIKGKLSLERVTMKDNILWLVRAKTAFEHLPHEHFTSFADTECVIRCVPHYCEFHNWLEQIE